MFESDGFINSKNKSWLEENYLMEKKGKTFNFFLRHSFYDLLLNEGKY